MIEVDQELERTLAGDRRAATRLQADLIDSWERHDERFDGILDRLAAAASTGSQPATELLLITIHQLGLARPSILRLIVDPRQVDEAAQSTLVAVERGIGTFHGKSRFRTWLFTVARNEALALLRSASRTADDQAFEETAAAEVRPTARLSSVIASRATVQEAVDSLPSPYRETLELRVRSQLEYPEIAEQLGVPVGTVKSRIAKARGLLVSELGGSVLPRS